MFRFLIAFLLSTPALGQFLANPSFEGTQQANIPPAPWTPCNDYSTPDTQPGFWGINFAPSNGNSYVSLFTRGSGGFLNDGIPEAIGTPLAKSLKKDSCYFFSIDLAFFSKATFTGSWGEFIEYKNPTTLKIYGGTSSCQKSVVLYQSATITNEQWQAYAFTITPDRDISFLTLEANYVNGEIKFGCLLLDNFKIQSMSVSLGNDRAICEDDVITLHTGTETGSVLWNTGSTDRSLTVTSPGEYSVTVTNGGCTATDHVTITYVEPLNLDLGEEKILCIGETITLDASATNQLAQYRWSTGSTNPSISVATQGLYQVTVKNGCQEISNKIKVTFVKDNCCNLNAPNVFTPNADGVNDLFEVASPSPLEKFQLKIYNRWGTIVFEGTDINNYWNGTTSNGQEAASGIYFWVSTIKCSRGDFVFDNAFRGTVTLLR